MPSTAVKQTNQQTPGSAIRSIGSLRQTLSPKDFPRARRPFLNRTRVVFYLIAVPVVAYTAFFAAYCISFNDVLSQLVAGDMPTSADANNQIKGPEFPLFWKQ